MTAHPKPGTVLSAESVKLLLPGDVLAVVNADSFLSTRGFGNGKTVTFRSLDHGFIDIADLPYSQGSSPSRFTFVCRPSLEPPASDVAGWRRQQSNGGGAFGRSQGSSRGTARGIGRSTSRPEQPPTTASGSRCLSPLPLRTPHPRNHDPMSESLNELEALAKAATPGPWEMKCKPFDLEAKGRAIHSSDGYGICRTWDENGKPENAANAAFIAAADPQTILDLIAQVRALQHTPEPVAWPSREEVQAVVERGVLLAINRQSGVKGTTERSMIVGEEIDRTTNALSALFPIEGGSTPKEPT